MGMNWAELVAKLAEDENALTVAIASGIVEQVELTEVKPVEVKQSLQQIIDACEELEAHEFEFDPAEGAIGQGDW